MPSSRGRAASAIAKFALPRRLPPAREPASGQGDQGRLEEVATQSVPDLSHLHRLDQHGAALAAADAFGGDALPDAEPLHGVDEMQHDAVAARAHRMAERDRAAIDVQLVARRSRRRRRRARAPRGRTCRPPRRRGRPAPARRTPRSAPTARCRRAQRVPAQDRGRAQHRAEPHDRGIERRPFAVDDHRARRQLVLLHASSEARITQDAPSVICEELPAVTLPQGRSNAGLSLASFSTVLSGRTPSS